MKFLHYICGLKNIFQSQLQMIVTNFFFLFLFLKTNFKLTPVIIIQQYYETVTFLPKVTPSGIHTSPCIVPQYLCFSVLRISSTYVPIVSSPVFMLQRTYVENYICSQYLCSTVCVSNCRFKHSNITFCSVMIFLIGC